MVTDGTTDLARELRPSSKRSVRLPVALRARLAPLVLIGALMASCGAQVSPATSGPAETPEPMASTRAQASPSPCTVAVTRLGAFTRLIADDLASLRPLVVAASFDSAETVRATRRVSATLTAYVGLEQSLRTCDATVELAHRVEVLRTGAKATLAMSLSSAIADAQVQRDAAVSLLELLPEVLVLSEAARSVADNLGVALEVAQVPDGAVQPVGSLPPLPTPGPTPKPTPLPTAAAIKPSFFGPGVKISTYNVSGDTPREISRSIEANGPYSKWLGGNAAGQTRTVVTNRFHFEVGSGGCQIVVEATPAIRLTYTIILPRWTPSSGTSTTTIKWWNEQLGDIATHEKVHVDIYRSAAKQLNSALASSACADAERHLEAVWDDAERENCEFDMKEYGASSGLSLRSCLAQ